MTEHDSWQAFGRVYAGDPEKLFEEVRSVRMLLDRDRLVDGLHVEQRLSGFSRRLPRNHKRCHGDDTPTVADMIPS